MNELILIIDSNTQTLKKLREILSREGFNIMTVMNVESAINILRKIKIDYLLANPKELELLNITTKKEEKWKR